MRGTSRARRKGIRIAYLVDSGPYPVRVNQSRLTAAEARTRLLQSDPGLTPEAATDLIATAHERAAAKARNGLAVDPAGHRGDGTPLYRVNGSEPRNRFLTIHALESEYRCTTAEAQQLVDAATTESPAPLRPGWACAS